jgi:serine/threonine protein kinase
MSEFQLLSKLTHPNVIHAYEMYIDDVVGKVYIVMELFQGFTLTDIINKVRYQQLPGIPAYYACSK